MRSVLLIIVVALCGVLAPAVSSAAICTPPKSSSSSKPHAPTEELPREERETCRVRHVVTSVDRGKAAVREPGVRAAVAPSARTPAFAQTAVDIGALWRTPPALQVFRN